MSISGRGAALALLVLGVVAGAFVSLGACASQSPHSIVASCAHVGYALGGLVCHQRADRSFVSCGRQWPVCGRCAGLYLGFAAGAIVVLPTARLRRRSSARRAPADRGIRWWRRALLLAAAPTAGLWLLEFVGGVDPGSLVRFAGALSLGLAAALWLDAVRLGDLR